MPGGHLGTIWASVALDTAPLGAGAARARRQMYALDATMSKSASGMGAHLLGIGVSAGIMAGVVALAATKMAADFEKNVAKTAALADASASRMEMWSDTLLDMSAAGQTSAKDLGDAWYFAVSNMPDASDADRFETLKIAEKGAVGGVAELEDAIRALTTIQNAYAGSGVELQKPIDYMDVMQKSVERGSLNLQEFVSNLGKVSGSAALAKVPFQEIGAAVSTLTRKGVPVETAFMALNQTIMTMVKPTKQAKDAAEKLGITFDLNTLRTKGLAGSLMMIADAIGEDDSEFAQLFPNIRALKAVLPLAGISMNEFTADLQAMGQAGGKTEQMFKTMSQTTSFQFAKAMNNMKKAMIELGQKLLPTATKIANAIGNIFAGKNEAINTFARTLKGVVKPIWDISTALLSLKPVLYASLAAFIAWKTGLLSAIASVTMGEGVLGTYLAATFGSLAGLAGLLPLIPFAATAAAIGAFTYKIWEEDKAAQAAYDSHVKWVKSSADMATSTLPLVGKLEDLRKKQSELTEGTPEYAEVAAQIAEVNAQIAENFPSLIAGFDGEGKAILQSIDAMKKYLAVKLALAGVPTTPGASTEYQSMEIAAKKSEQAKNNFEKMYNRLNLMTKRFGEMDFIPPDYIDQVTEGWMRSGEEGRSAMESLMAYVRDAGIYSKDFMAVWENGMRDLTGMTKEFGNGLLGEQEKIGEFSVAWNMAVQDMIANAKEVGAAAGAIPKDVTMSFLSSVPQFQVAGVQAFSAYIQGISQGSVGPELANSLAQSIFSGNTFALTASDAVNQALQAMANAIQTNRTAVAAAQSLSGAIKTAFESWGTTKKETKEVTINVTETGGKQTEVALKKTGKAATDLDKKDPTVNTTQSGAMGVVAAMWEITNAIDSIPSSKSITVHAKIETSSVKREWEHAAEAGAYLAEEMARGGTAVGASIGMGVNINYGGVGMPTMEAGILNEIATGYDIVAKSFGTYKAMMDSRPFNEVINAINGLTNKNESSIKDWQTLTSTYNAATQSLKDMEKQIKTTEDAIKGLQDSISAPSEAYQQELDQLTLKIMQAEDKFDYAEAARLTLQKEKLQRKKEELDLTSKISEYDAEAGKPGIEHKWLTMTPDAIAKQIAKWQKELVKKQSEVEALRVRYDDLQTSVNDFKSVIDNLTSFLNTRWQELMSATPENPAPSYALGTDYVPATGWAWVHKGEQIYPAGSPKLSEFKVSIGESSVTTPVYLDGKVLTQVVTRRQGHSASAYARSGGRY